MTIPNRNFNYPTAIKFGAGRIKELADHCKANGITRPLLVTDPGLAAMPMVGKVVDDLRRAGLGIAVFIDVRDDAKVVDSFSRREQLLSFDLRGQCAQFAHAALQLFMFVHQASDRRIGFVSAGA